MSSSFNLDGRIRLYLKGSVHYNHLTSHITSFGKLYVTWKRELRFVFQFLLNVSGQSGLIKLLVL